MNPQTIINNESPDTTPFVPVAVVGLGALFPGGAGVETFWHHIVAGSDLITDIPAGYWLPEDYYDADPLAKDKVYSRRGAFLDPTDFDPLEYGILPTSLKTTDAAQLLALVVAKQALAEAKGAFGDPDRERFSVILGGAPTTQLCAQMAGRLGRPAWASALRKYGMSPEDTERVCDDIAAHFPEWQESTFPGLLGNVVAGRIANRFDLGGTNCIVDAACASSLSAVSMGLNELQLGRADAVLTGGVDCLNDVLMYMCFSRTGAMSRSEECRPFSDAADGTMMGEGVGMLVLRRLEDAERDGNRIYAVIRGCGTSSDGRAKSIYAPRPEGHVRAYRRAYAQAGYGPETVELVEAHGTGTVAGDAAELEGLREVFGAVRTDDQCWCALGSIKSQIGHTKGAAGAAGLMKAILAVHQGVLPPTIKVDQPAPALAEENGPFYLNTEARPWVRPDSADAPPRRAAVSSFGFGGTNFHITLEEWRGANRAPRLRTSAAELILVGGSDPAPIAQRCRELADQVESDPRRLSYLAYTSQANGEGFAAVPLRVAISARNAAEMATRLRAAANRCATSSLAEDAFVTVESGIYFGSGANEGKTAFLFPGQGSQYLGMGAELALFSATARTVWDWATTILSDEPLHDVVFPAPSFKPEARKRQEERLRQTEWAQPALGAASLAVLRLLRAARVPMDLVAGHSFGELVALHAAGVFGEDDLLRAAQARGTAMATAGKGAPGAMIAVLHSTEETKRLLWGSQSVPDLVLANDNSPEQAVLSGPVAAIAEAERRLTVAGIRFVPLPVSTAFHSPLVADATTPFRSFLETILLAAPVVPVISGKNGEAFPTDETALRDQLAAQIAEPIRFRDQVEQLYARGARTFVEVGAGAVLSGLVSACLRDKPEVRVVSLDKKGTDGVVSLWDALAQLAAAGVPLFLHGLWNAFEPPTDPGAQTPARTSLSLTGAQHGKPYPADTEDRTPKSVQPAFRLAAVYSDLENALPQPSPVVPPASSPIPERSPAVNTDFENVSRIASYDYEQEPFADSEYALDTYPDESENDTYPESTSVLELLAKTQMAFQETMLAGHQEFLRTMEACARPGSANHRRAAAPPAPSVRAAVPTLPVIRSPRQLPPSTPRRPERNGAAHPERNGYATPTIPATVSQRELYSAAEAELVFAPPQPPAPVAASATIPAPVSAPATSDLTLESITDALMEAVSEKTGYPRDVLTLDIEMEGGLGIDSIKRVEILSALQSRLPNLPTLPLDQLATLATLGQIVDYVRDRFENNGGGAATAKESRDGEPPRRGTDPLPVSPH